MLGKCLRCNGDHRVEQCPERIPKPRFEAEVLYEGEHRELLEKYADSMGWEVEGFSLGALAALRREGDNEGYVHEDLSSAVAFFESEGARPVQVRVVRVVYDSLRGIDELTQAED